MELRTGDRIRHLKRPEWGLGKVLEVTSGGKARVHFVEAGERKLVLAHAAEALQKVAGEEAQDYRLDNLAASGRGGGRHMGLREAHQAFLRQFPEGFAGEDYLGEERNYKVAASQELQELLGEQVFRGLLDASNHEEITRRALRVVNLTNLLFPQEKMALRDGLHAPQSQEAFARALFALLYGEGSFRSRFDRFAACLEELGAAKWTAMTYFPFMASPQEHVFLKPMVTQRAAQLLGVELDYDTKLNWATYAKLLELTQYLREKLVEMGMQPRDLIDVQSFMWCTLGEQE